MSGKEKCEDRIVDEKKTVFVAARLELLATLSREAEDLLRRHPDATYQDTDSVVMRDTLTAREAMLAMRHELNRLYGRFGVRQTIDR